MRDINRIVMEGRLTRDIGDRGYRALPDGTGALSFSIANNYGKREGGEWVEEASFIDVDCFGRQADALAKVLRKGSRVIVDGSLRQERWTGKDGSRKSAWRIRADHVRLVGEPRGATAEPADEPERQETAEEDEFLDDVPF